MVQFVTHEPTRTRSGVRCEGLVRIFKTAEIEVVALQGLDLHVDPGEIITVVGASGSGKSTLLNVLGGLDEPTAGTAVVGSHDLMRMSGVERNEFRRDVVGFVWQQTSRNLQPYLDARRNVEFPLAIAGVSRRTRRIRAEQLLELVGLIDRADHRPSELSGGEQQRVAIAVALANDPQLLLADEPTGELDVATAIEVFGVLRRVNEELGVTAVIVTHDPLVSQQVDRTVSIRDGRISSEIVREGAGLDASRVIAREFSVLDSAGRLQLPEHYLAALDLQRRVRLELEPDHVGVWRDVETDEAAWAKPEEHDQGGLS
ncbi:MAG: ABC transporter ATP-binding protein [Ilumatobacter fluminis]|uniref:ABC transporter ATP-binding protein n=1 Tax=Ilumatobacter fluminis TaxID=467091 RepID=UPI0032ED0C84